MRKNDRCRNDRSRFHCILTGQIFVHCWCHSTALESLLFSYLKNCGSVTQKRQMGLEMHFFYRFCSALFFNMQSFRQECEEARQSMYNVCYCYPLSTKIGTCLEPQCNSSNSTTSLFCGSCEVITYRQMDRHYKVEGYIL